MKRVISLILGGLWLLVVIIASNVMDDDLTLMPGSLTLAGSLEAGSTFEDLFRLSDDMYGLLELSPKNAYTDRYRIIEISENGQMELQTPILEISCEKKFSDFIAAPEGFYITFLADDDQSAETFFIEKDVLTEDAEGEEPLVPELYESFSYEDGTRINWASYSEGRFVVWSQDGSGASFYEANIARDEDCQQFIMDAGEKRRIDLFTFALCAVAVIIGWAVIWLFMYLLWDKSSTVYLIALTETLLLIIAVAGTVFIIRGHRNAAEEETGRFARYYMDVLGEEADGDEAKLNALLKAFSESEAAGVNLKDICAVEPSDHRIVASISGKNGVVLEDVYDDDQRMVWDESGGTSPWILVTVLYDRSGLSGDGFGRSCMAAAAGLFVIASILCVAFLTERQRDLRSFGRALSDVSSGESCAVSGRYHTKDMEAFWNALMEIQKKFQRVNYSRYQIFESCYRFAPQNIEKIFGKGSITEVSSGDTVTLDGTIAFVSYDEPDYRDKKASEKINRFVSVLEKYQDENGGFFVSGCSDLSEMKILFPEESGRGTKFGTDFLNTFYSTKGAGKSGIFLHHASLMYGVAGNDNQAFPFLLLDDKELLERYAAWFGSMNIRMVMTGEVLKNEDYRGEVRYIGYLLLHDKKMDLYEALNVCSAWERRLKLDTDEKFQNALHLFYGHDFYLARSGFSDVLKENDADQIARWYLFTCEKYLNESHSEGDICSMQI